MSQTLWMECCRTPFALSKIDDKARGIIVHVSVHIMLVDEQMQLIGL